MIKISEIFIKEESGETLLCASLEISLQAKQKWMSFSRLAKKYQDYTYINDDYQNQSLNCLWFAVDSAYQGYLSDDVCDAFIVALLFYAMATGEDIYSTVPMSEDLHFHLTHFLIPALANTENISPIQVIAPLTDACIKTNDYVGTGMSMGVDSFQSLYEFHANDIPKRYRLTHLVYLNVGSDRWRLRPEQSMQNLVQQLSEINEIRENRIKQSSTIAEQANLNFLYINSNISDFYMGLFEETHLYRTCAAILSVQRAFSKYYLASTGLSLNDYHLALRTDPAHYEQLLLPNLSTIHLEFLSAGKPYTRIDKMMQLSNYDLAKQYLITCDQESTCYHCTKDYRTIIILDIIGKQNEFSNVFDPGKVKKVRNKAYYWMLVNHKSNPAASLVYEHAKKKKLIPKSVRVKYYIFLPIISIRKRLK